MAGNYLHANRLAAFGAVPQRFVTTANDLLTRVPDTAVNRVSDTVNRRD
jgi:hypothetical protein